MGKSFKHITVCTVGKFGDNTDKIPLWVNANGGTYSRILDDSVTHLVVTEEAYKVNGSIVKRAKVMKNVKIVSYDWLEDSLQSKSRLPKVEKNYLWESILKNKTKNRKENVETKMNQRNLGKEENKRKSRKKQPQSATKRLQTTKTTEGYHPYLSPETGSLYFAKLERMSPFQQPINSYTTQSVKVGGQRLTYAIKVWQCKESPQNYAVVVRNSRIGKCEERFLVPPGGSYDEAMSAFKDFFREKTGISWEDRYRDSFSYTQGGENYKFDRPRGLLAGLAMSIEQKYINRELSYHSEDQALDLIKIAGESHLSRGSEMVAQKIPDFSIRHHILAENDELHETK